MTPPPEKPDMNAKHTPITPEQESIVIAASEGNMGAITVSMGLINAGRFDVLRTLHKNGITGVKLWLSFKDLGDQTIDTLVSNVEAGNLVQRLAALGYA